MCVGAAVTALLAACTQSQPDIRQFYVELKLYRKQKRAVEKSQTTDTDFMCNIRAQIQGNAKAFCFYEDNDQSGINHCQPM